MKLIHGNLWEYANDPKYILCITTNGFVKKNGEAVMGRGCAKEAAQRYPKLPKELGYSIKTFGNEIAWFFHDTQELISFPVKHNWWEKADLDLIKKSTEDLYGITTCFPKDTFILPKPGCGNGQLKWEEVEPILKVLPDSVWIIDF